MNSTLSSDKKESYPLLRSSFFINMKETFVLFLYIIILILIFTLGNKKAIDHYAIGILLALVPIGIFLFYSSLKTINTGIHLSFNMNLMKYSIIFFCLLLFVAIFYFSNPGNYVEQYSGPYMLFTWLLILFGFIFLLTFVNFPTTSENGIENTGIFRGFTLFSIINVVLFIGFIIAVTYYLSTIPTNTSDFTSIAVLSSLLVVVWLIFTIMGLGVPNTNQLNAEESQQSTFSKYFLNALFLVTGLTTVGLLIVWIINSTIMGGSSSSTWRLVLNICVVLAAFGIFFKLLSSTTYYNKSPLLRLILDSVFYIPCLVVNLVDLIVQYILGPIYHYLMAPIFKYGSKYGPQGLKAAKGVGTNLYNTNRSYYIILLTTICLYLLKYIVLPYTNKKKAQSSGTLIVNKPIALNVENTLGGYKELNNIPDVIPSVPSTSSKPFPYNYQFALSFWLLFDGVSNQNAPNNINDTTVLNVFDIIKLDYNSKLNTLKFNVLNNKNSTDFIYLYGLENITQQKWNNIILNYNNGTLDIFYNGVLVNSANSIVPQMSYENITSGSGVNGIDGGICNVNFFNKILTNTQIYDIYNSNKLANPPVIPYMNYTIIPVEKRTQQSTITNDVNASSNININLPLSFTDEPTDITVADGEILATPDNTFDTDYLSLKWFFTNNGNTTGGLE